MSTRFVGPLPVGRHLGPLLVALMALVLLGGCAMGHPLGGRLSSGHDLHSPVPSRLSDSRPKHPATSLVQTEGMGSAGGFPEQTTDAFQGGRATGCLEEEARPPGWPNLSSGDSEELLAPFLACTSVADFMELQRGVDMPRLVEALDDWHAVRLGALGPLGADAAEVLNRKRASYLVYATEEYGVVYAEVFATFVLHSAFDDELKQVLVLLARDKQLGQTLGLMPAVRAELERRGLKLSDYADRGEQPGDVLRGLGRAARDALNSTQQSDGARYMNMSAQLLQLPPPYRESFHEVERALMRQHFAPDSVALGCFDHLTFGMPLGFYHLVAGSGHGLYSLTQGQYEQATRELAPAALMGALYARGKAMRYLSEARGVTSAGMGLQVMELRLGAIKEMARQLEARLGADGIRELARYIQANREAAAFVGAGGEPAAAALFEARGDVAKAQVWLSQAKPQRAGPQAARSGAGKSSGGVADVAEEPARPRASAEKSFGGMASLVDVELGLTPEVVEAKLFQAELETAGPRLPADVALLKQQRPSLEAPPPGVPEGSALWSEYVTYRGKRLAELAQGKAVEGPLRWEAYEQMRGLFARGLVFERIMVALFRADAALPRAQRRWLKDFNMPRVETNVGVAKEGVPGVRYADVLVIEEQPPAGQPPRVETFSFKSRNLASLTGDLLKAQMTADARDALRYYGGTLDIRRPSLKLRVRVQRVRLIYEGDSLKPKAPGRLQFAVNETQNAVKGVEVLVQ
ncbi:hypothetical protein [Vitiosangium sp. GDMCC 1.1324]|uniref:hypothetical protein n=1 Tax=Vitiosangium sp. (strain GDMCC 1.1324) TaxID=2138576 RepID=UPI000D3C2CC9|nr:hypothetical protein [Vitiosangium sp. GDMCC 1.1324]PTL81830.1 hypothetical protein DAT35_23135 [Vitiosangium sp. GDMCC 1.1324]